MESSLSILKPNRLQRLRETNCVYVAPGIESWVDYSAKAGVGSKSGEVKLDQVVEHFRQLGDYVQGMQANFLFGGDEDAGTVPAELTKTFIERTPRVWPTINIPTPFGATPLRERYAREGRILETLPFAFYYNPYLAIRLKHYDPVTYYDHLIDIHKTLASARMLRRRVMARSRPAIRFIHGLRTFAAHTELVALRRIRKMLVTDRQFRAFHEGETTALPPFYRQELRDRLGRYADILSLDEITPVAEHGADDTRSAASQENSAVSAHA
jgi:hypothetical protein